MTAPATSRGARFLPEIRSGASPVIDTLVEAGGTYPLPPLPHAPSAAALAPVLDPLATPARPGAELPADEADDHPLLAATADLAPLHLRLGLLQVLRATLAVIVVGTAFWLPASMGGHLGPGLAALSAAYLAISSGLEWARRCAALRSAALVSGLVLFDGAYLAMVMAFTGGPQSPLSFLVLVHVIGVTLLLSFRNGLKVALWHALLLFLTSWLTQAGVVGDRAGSGPAQAAVLGAVALLVVAVATAWFSSLNEGELRRGKAEMRALAEMAGRMAATRDPAVLVHALLDGVAEAFGHQRSAVVLADPETHTAFALCPDGSMDEVATEPAAAAAVRNSLGVVDGHATTVPLLLRAFDEERDRLLVAAMPDASNIMVAPLVVDGRPLGALAVERGGGRRARVTSRSVDLLAQFAAHAAMALRAAALQAEVERLARTDGLTGLANRRSFEDALQRELAVSVRRGEPCGLIILDVDHFKRVNDTHGHQMGDAVLEEVAWALGTTARTIDVVARYGGEEFAVILPGCTASEAWLVAERLRAAVAGAPALVPVTMSAGVAVFPVDGATAAALVAAADTALYKAKRQGRDRSVRFRRPRRPVRSRTS